MGLQRGKEIVELGDKELWRSAAEELKFNGSTVFTNNELRSILIRRYLSKKKIIESVC